MSTSSLPLIGLRKDGRPIYLMQGGSEDGSSTEGADGKTGEKTGNVKVDVKPDPAALKPLIDEAVAAAVKEAEESWRKTMNKKNAENHQLRNEKKDIERRLAEIEKTGEDPGPDSSLAQGGQPAPNDNGNKAVDSLETRLKALEAATAREARNTLLANLAQKYSLPGWATARLTGDTPEALEADAKALSDHVREISGPRGIRDVAFGRGTEQAPKATVDAGRAVYDSRKKK